MVVTQNSAGNGYSLRNCCVIKCEIWASHSGVDEDSSFLGYDVMSTGKQLSGSGISRRVLLGSLTLKILTIYQSTRRNIRKNLNIRVIICSPISRSILKPMVDKRQHRQSISWKLCQVRSPNPTCLIFFRFPRKSLLIIYSTKMLKGKGNVPLLNYAVRNEDTFRTGGRGVKL